MMNIPNMPSWVMTGHPVRAHCVVVHPLKLIYQPVNKAASTGLDDAIRLRWAHDAESLGLSEAIRYGSEYAVVGMFRDPFARLESAYRYLSGCQRQRYVATHNVPPTDLPFSAWVAEVCSIPDYLRDKHICSQIGFHWHLDHIVCWDFGKFARLFDIDEPGVVNASQNQKPTNWDDTAWDLFTNDHAFKRDITVCRGKVRTVEFY